MPSISTGTSTIHSTPIARRSKALAKPEPTPVDMAGTEAVLIGMDGHRQNATSSGRQEPHENPLSRGQPSMHAIRRQQYWPTGKIELTGPRLDNSQSMVLLDAYGPEK